MTHQELKELFEAKSHWRSQCAEKYPDDSRNEKAVEILDRLAATAVDVPQHLLDAYAAAFLRGETSDKVNTEQIVLDALGFREPGFPTPQNATESSRAFLSLTPSQTVTTSPTGQR
jgi:hypothetical protein